MQRTLEGHRPVLWLASLLALAGFAYTWLGPSGTSCVSTSGSVSIQHCISTTLAAGMPLPLLAAVLVASVAFSLVPLLLERRLWVQVVWFAVIMGFFVLSFGIDIWLLPAALAAAVDSGLRMSAPHQQA
ncbi:MAG: hypothetical protein M0Z66_06855 [Thermaerobacter sp.]|nr:hypothetical protein [Thermaerobacter sp.]